MVTLPGAVIDDGRPSSRRVYVMVPAASMTETRSPTAFVVLVTVIPSLLWVTDVPE